MNIPLNINWQQILLHLLNFVILIGGLYILLYKPVKDFMEKRQKTYKDMDDKANKALKDAEDKVKEYESRIANADEEIAQIKSEASVEAMKAASAQIESAKKQADLIIENAKVKANVQRDRIIAGANDEIKQLAVDMTRKLSSGEGVDYFQEFLDSANQNSEEDK